MTLAFILGDPERRESAVTIGSFDGVHLGHRKVLDLLASVADDRGLSAVVATFDPHPRVVLGGQHPELLTSVEERSNLLAELGIERFAAIDFTHDIASMSPELFVEDILVNRLGAKVVIVGHDHRFGQDRRGDVNLLKALGGHHGFDVIQCDPLEWEQATVSSSRVRSLLRTGDVSGAAMLLGRRYAVSGRVIHGAGRGRRIGIPTANISPLSLEQLIPGIGVYAVLVSLPGASELHPGMMNIGRRPTFDGVDIHLEVHLLDWSGDLYEREVRVEFVQKIRNEQKFDSVDGLIQQLNKDRDRCSALLRDLS
ncbi:MAG: bifunctional riboflavin kinase/FAD synthetase [Bacteroidetes bacterium]|nr:bifunctional riboflavin kinase/FAD synthetase [Bacteroidota bacterium]MDA1334161.1 bifunctional riboflavin kinase/FAD synthetase [Bacteroidota bacterium]